MLEHFGYETILAKESLNINRMSMISVKIILLDIQSWSTLIVQKLKRLKPLIQAPVLCLIDPNQFGSIADQVFNVCDDFILKPFSPEELDLRIRWIQNSHHSIRKPIEHRISTDSEMKAVSSMQKAFRKHSYFKIDEEARLILIKDQRVHLTPKEYKLFCLLGSSVGKIFSNQEIISSIWPNTQNATDKDVQQYVYSLRKKIEENPSKPRFLINVPGFGYKLEAEEHLE